MGRKPEKEVVKWLTLEELNEEICRRKISSELLRKLCSSSSERRLE
ncbi:MAG: hypothetical protein ACXQTX_01495 [Candidatus Syntropharchaeia archaeon]